MSGKEKRAAGLVIFRRRNQTSDPQWLLLQTSYGEHHWTPPKGHLDPGENDITAAVRETEEEAGLSRSQLEIFDEVKAELKYQAFGKPKVVVYWLAKLSNYEDTVVLSDEHQAFKWLSLDEARELSGFEDMKKVFTDFHCQVLNRDL